MILLGHQVFAQLRQLGNPGRHGRRQGQIGLPLRLLGGQSITVELPQIAH